MWVWVGGRVGVLLAWPGGSEDEKTGEGETRERAQALKRSVRAKSVASGRDHFSIHFLCTVVFSCLFQCAQ